MLENCNNENGSSRHFIEWKVDTSIHTGMYDSF